MDAGDSEQQNKQPALSEDQRLEALLATVRHEVDTSTVIQSRGPIRRYGFVLAGLLAMGILTVFGITSFLSGLGTGIGQGVAGVGDGLDSIFDCYGNAVSSPGCASDASVPEASLTDWRIDGSQACAHAQVVPPRTIDPDEWVVASEARTATGSTPQPSAPVRVLNQETPHSADLCFTASIMEPVEWHPAPEQSRRWLVAPPATAGSTTFAPPATR